MTISAQFYTEVYDMLKYQCDWITRFKFQLSDFEILTSEKVVSVKGKGATNCDVLSIRFRPKSNYVLVTALYQDENSGSSVFIVSMVPGEIQESQQYNAIDKDKFMSLIPEWMKNMAGSLTSSVNYRKIMQLEEEVKSVFDSISKIEVKQEYSSQQIEQIIFEMSELKTALAETISKLDQNEKDNSALKKDYEKLSEEIDSLKQRVQVLDTNGFLKSAFPTFIRWSKDEKIRPFIIKNGIRLLQVVFSGEVKDSLPGEVLNDIKALSAPQESQNRDQPPANLTEKDNE